MDPATLGHAAVICAETVLFEEVRPTI